MDLLIMTTEQKHSLPASIIALYSDKGRMFKNRNLLLKLSHADHNCKLLLSLRGDFDALIFLHIYCAGMIMTI